MFIGTLLFDLLLPADSRSLKDKRGYLRPLIAALRKYEVCVAEVGDHDRHGRAQVGIGVVAADAAHVREVLDRCERTVAGHPEFELLAVQRRLVSDSDLD